MIPVNLTFALRKIRSASERQEVIVVIDVLRATSTIVTAIENGAKNVIPTTTIKEARSLWKKYPQSLLAGERRGFKPQGFHLGNSPREFRPEVVAGRDIILTTSSGTETIVAAKASAHVLIASFLNAEAAAETALKIAENERKGITLAPSGCKHHFSLEDFLCAGAITSELRKPNVELSDFAWGALLAFKGLKEPLNQAVWKSNHARELKDKGLGEDVEFCSQLNIFKTVPILKAGRISGFQE